MLTSLFVEGEGPLHLIGVRTKLALLLIVGLGLHFVSNPIVLALTTLVTGGLYFSTGLRVGEALRRVRPVFLTIAILGVFNIVLLSPVEALSTTLRLLAVLFLAAAITATTTIAAFMTVITALALPLERLGLLKAADVGLAFGLVLRFVPEIAARHEALKEAHAARGIPVKLSRMLGPLIISTLKDADRIAEAIDARGIRGQ